MLYLYDDAIVKDLKRSFNPDAVNNPLVKVVDPEAAIGLAAMLQDDDIRFPLVAITRDPDTPIDIDRLNFTRAHIGVTSVLDPDTNELYYERAIPIKLSYKLTILTTNTADMDEMVRELMFKYISMYFLTITLPYECRRKVRFGLCIDTESNIERKSGTFDYIESGKLHETTIPIKCDGCVLVHYTPAKLARTVYEIEHGLSDT